MPSVSTELSKLLIRENFLQIAFSAESLVEILLVVSHPVSAGSAGAALCYFNAKSTVKVSLSFNKVEKTKVESFDFLHLLSSSFFFHKNNSKSIP